jgi:hypothetical protein
VGGEGGPPSRVLSRGDDDMPRRTAQFDIQSTRLISLALVLCNAMYHPLVLEVESPFRS